MLREVGKPLLLLGCMLSLLWVFHAAFLLPSSDLHERLREALATLGVAWAVAVLAGLFFSETDEVLAHPAQVLRTLPVRLFLWSSLGMVLLFALAWFVETFCMMHGDHGGFRH